MKNCIAAVITLCIVMQVNDALDFEKTRTAYSAKIFGFSWENCGKPDDPAVLKTLTLSPDPITVPGDLTASASGNTTVELAAPLAVNVTLEKEVAGFWVTVPCLEEIGSCHYTDGCDLLNLLIPPGQDCPEPLHTYGIPCHCPFKARKSKVKEEEKTVKEVNNSQDGGGGKVPLEELNVGLEAEKQLGQYEWQLKILREVLSASGTQEREELLKDPTQGELCALVHNIIEKVETETAADMTVLYVEKSQRTAEQHARQLEERQRRQSEERKRLTETHQAAEKVLKEEVEELTTELHVYNQLKKRVDESTFKKDLQRNIQAHGSPGPFWEQEQESLLFVIEMKSERIQEQGNKLLQMQVLVEKNLSLEDQVITVLQQNEDLTVRIDNHQSLIQQLSKEHQDLQGTLDRQAGLCQRLTQEKEQLMFKLKHRDSCPTFPSFPIVSEISPS
ncbi:coiled-coil domain-containing protein 69 [Oncorhynchus mykiss]|uniref:MD-2-related lipid-recognition domain-containing protein n=1 Tax=Oncorhynchus mykiss TaxID=8022 RepID=A0A8C7TP46_ONCMY|nr:coiled-coil domain-containing protein 69 [Oncorhynchus mykiss]